jgi:hypothetical protein
MSAEMLMRTVGVLTCATTLSLFTTIAAYAAVSVAPLKWDGSFCTARECGAAVALMRDTGTARLKLAELPARSS